MTKPKQSRSNQAQVASRTNEIYNLMVQGITDRRKLHSYMDTHHWGLSPTQKDRYVTKATELLKATLEESQEESLALATRRLEDLYAKFNAAKDYNGALATLREFIRLKCCTVNPNAADTGITINILKVDSGLPAPREPVEVIDIIPDTNGGEE